MADESINVTTRNPLMVIPECPSLDLTVDSSWLETVVFGNFRIWHIMFSGIAVGTAVTVVLCCLFRCRIPRTKQEIEADFIRKKITDSFRSHLEKIKIDELQGQYSQTNLLPVLKKVELFEEDRVQKNEGFEKRKLTWKQKLKRIFTGGKESFDEFAEHGAEDSKAESDTHKMTIEEMENVEKEVEAIKTDLSAINMINDQIVIFRHFGESKHEKQKRLKAEKKAAKAQKKEQKLKDKLEKKMANEQDKRQSIVGSSGVSSARSKSTQKLLELRGDTLDVDHRQDDVNADDSDGGDDGNNVLDSTLIDMTNIDQVNISIDEAIKGQNGIKQLSQDEIDKGYQEITLPIPEKSELPSLGKKLSMFGARFSFRDTVQKLMIRSFGGGGSSSSASASAKAKKEELVINIGMVKKPDSSDEATATTITTLSASPPAKIVTIPHIECSPPEYDEEDNELKASSSKHRNRNEMKSIKKKSKLNKKDSNVHTKEESVDRNLLHIPPIIKSSKDEKKMKEKVILKMKELEKKKRKEMEKEAKQLEKERKKLDKMAIKMAKKGKFEPTPEGDTKGDNATTKLDAIVMKDDVIGVKRNTSIIDSVKSGPILIMPEDEQKPNKKKKDKRVKVTIVDSKEDMEALNRLKKQEQKMKDNNIKLKSKLKHKEQTPEAMVKIKPQKQQQQQHQQQDQPLPSPEKQEIPKETINQKNKKEKRLEFDERIIEMTQTKKSDDQMQSKLGELDRRKRDTFPVVVEKVKERQRRIKTDIIQKLGGKIGPEIKESKTLKPKTKVKSKLAPVAKVEKQITEPVLNLNEEVKIKLEQQRKRNKEMKRSSTIDEQSFPYQSETIESDEDRRMVAKTKDEFKKRLSGVLLKQLDSDTKNEKTKSSVTKRKDSKERIESSEKLKPIRIIRKQGTSSSEIEIPVEHVYTRGMVTVHVEDDAKISEPPTTSHSQMELIPCPKSSCTTVTIPKAATTQSSRPSSPTLSVTTDNIVKRLVETSPERGESHEITYTRSRDVIFSVQSPSSATLESSIPLIDDSKQEQPQSSKKEKDRHKSGSGSVETKKKKKNKKKDKE
ncbi:hypothetical protein BLOT_001259 [Blomia tropicalis]|nr:hypothetical protein BLOT_001259 [Blomia tropicalis]